MGQKTPVAAKEGWFTLDVDNPRLLGSRCTACGSIFFPAEATYCRNPACDSESFEERPLSNRGRVWSYTNACYTPPAPFVPKTDPFEPFALAAVELPDEKLIVLGQVTDGVTVDQLSIGQDIELALDVLYSDDEHDYMTWCWKPVDGGAE